MLDKGVPSTFANLKHLYKDEAKKTALYELVVEYLSSKESGDANEDSTRGKGAAVYYLAQHFNYYRSRDLDKAMEYVDKAIELDKEDVDFAMTKARIWKHRGNPEKASEAMENARLLATRDRYTNTKAAKYQLRNNDTEKALTTMGMFTKADTPGGPLADLMDMQSIWFLTEDGEANARLGNTGLALKRFHTVYNIFDIWQEDQFDFHSFSLRKGMIRAYIDMVRWEDHLRDHPFYTRAAIDAINVYLGIHEEQTLKAANGLNGSANGGTNGEDALEKKKAAKKAKKEAIRLEKEAAEKAAKQDPNKAKGKQDDDALKKKDDDPNGEKLAATTEPLVAAMRFINPMLQCSPKSVDAQTTAFEVLILRSKFKSPPLALHEEYVLTFLQRSTSLLCAASKLRSLSTPNTPRSTSKPSASATPSTPNSRRSQPKLPRCSKPSSQRSLLPPTSPSSTRSSAPSTRAALNTCCQVFACRRRWVKTRPSSARTLLRCCRRRRCS